MFVLSNCAGFIKRNFLSHEKAYPRQGATGRPLTREQMFTIMFDMALEINESIKVAAVFSRGEVRPVWFDWKGRQIRVSETTFTWKTREGSAVILHFSVSDGQGLYEICYNAESLGWRLMNAEGG
jgi:hypothetical protein